MKYSSRTVAGDSLYVFSFVLFPAQESTQLGSMSGKWDLVLSKGLVLQLAGCVAFGGPRGGVPEGSDQRLQNNPANGLTFRWLKGEFFYLFFL